MQANKKIKDMTPEERREYNNELSRRCRDRMRKFHPERYKALKRRSAESSRRRYERMLPDERSAYRRANAAKHRVKVYSNDVAFLEMQKPSRERDMMLERRRRQIDKYRSVYEVCMAEYERIREEKDAS